MQPTAEMMRPIQAVARFMATGDDAGLRNAFAGDCVVVENFAPFLFEGPGAFERWREGFCAHSRRHGLSHLRWRFGEAHDVARDGARAFLVLPTRWTGEAAGRPFSEDGGWAFVLEAAEDRWRIRSYAWAVTATT